MKARTLLSGLALLATLVAIGYALESGMFGELDKDWIDRAVRGHGVAGELVFIGVAGAATAVALPRQAVSFLGGYGFGFATGAVLALIGTELGCLIAVVYARLIGRPLLGNRLRGRFERIDRFLARNPFAMTLLIRLLPVGSNFATNLAAGLSRVPIAPFLLGSLIGYLPQTIVFALAGSGVQFDATPRIALSALLFALSGAIGAWLYRRYRHGATLGSEVDNELSSGSRARRPSILSTLLANRWLITLLTGWLLLSVASIWLRPLWPVDETRYASVAWDMWVRGEFLVPYVNGEPYAHKPPLLFWIIHAGWLAFGVNEWWPRLVGPLCAALSVPLMMRLERLLWPAGEARGAPIFVLFGSLLFVAFITLTMFDVLLMLCVMIAMIGLLRAHRGELRAGWCWFGAGIALGVLAKGPVILAHVLAVALIAPWWSQSARASWRRWYAGLLAALLGGAAIALLWAIPAAIHGGPDYARAIFWGQTAGRVSESFAHREPWWYYLALLPVLLFPWLLWPPLWRGVRALYHRERSPSTRFLSAWIVLTLIVFSLVSGKQAKYLVPMLPAFALIAGRALADSKLAARSRAMLLPALGFAAAAAIVVVVALRPAMLELPQWIDAVPKWPAFVLVAITAALMLVAKGDMLAQTRALAMAMLAGAATLIVGVVSPIAPYNDVTPTARRIAQLQAAGTPVAFIGKYHAQFNFIGRLAQPVDIVNDDDLGQWVEQHVDGIVIEIERERHQPGPDGPESETPFRGGHMIVWKGPNLLVHHLSEQLM